jgi:hypothetical protein
VYVADPVADLDERQHEQRIVFRRREKAEAIATKSRAALECR